MKEPKAKYSKKLEKKMRKHYKKLVEMGGRCATLECRCCPGHSMYNEGVDCGRNGWATMNHDNVIKDPKAIKSAKKWLKDHPKMEKDSYFKITEDLKKYKEAINEAIKKLQKTHDFLYLKDLRDAIEREEKSEAMVNSNGSGITNESGIVCVTKEEIDELKDAIEEDPYLHFNGEDPRLPAGTPVYIADNTDEVWVKCNYDGMVKTISSKKYVGSGIIGDELKVKKSDIIDIEHRAEGQMVEAWDDVYNFKKVGFCIAYYKDKKRPYVVILDDDYRSDYKHIRIIDTKYPGDKNDTL